MSFSVEQLPSCSFLSKRQSMLPSTDSKSSFSDITANQKHLIKQMLHLVELKDVYFDEEMNLSIKKCTKTKNNKKNKKTNPLFFIFQ